MKLLLAASILTFLNIAAPTAGVNPALMATRRLFTEQEQSIRNGYSKHFFKKAQRRRLDDMEDDPSYKAPMPPIEEDDIHFDVDDGSFNYYDNDDEYYYYFPPFAGTCMLSTQLTTGLFYEDERVDESFNSAFENQRFEEISELFDNICNSNGGQTLTIDFEASAGCGQPSLLNVPDCVGALCDQADIDLYASFFVAPQYFPLIENEECSIEATVVTDGEGDVSILDVVPADCLNGMSDIFFVSDIYELYPENMIDQDTGMFNGDTEALAMFTAQCTELGGRTTTSSWDYFGGECDNFDLTSVPLCVSDMCSKNEAHEVLSTFLGDTFSDETCEGVVITLATDNMVTDEMKAPKMPKSPKMPKTAKMPKSPKMPKTPKMPKEIKMPKTTKMPKFPKVL